MANMTLIEAKTVGSGGTAQIDFTNIPQTYRDLKLVISARDNRSGQPNDDISMRVGYNGTINTSNVYTHRRFFSNGSSQGSDSTFNTSLNTLAMVTGATAGSGIFSASEIYIANYSASATKQIYADGTSENTSSTAWIILSSAFINNTDPVTDIRLFPTDATLWSEFSTFYLYGIDSQLKTAKATGGIVYKTVDYFYHVFSSTSTFRPTQSITADILVVAGGGQGGGGNGGGGGGGGVLTYSSQSLTVQNYTVTIGGGGSGGVTNSNGGNGTASQFGSLTSSTGGGGGGGYNAGAAQNGGSGGGGGTAGNTTAGSTVGGGQGNNGGNGHVTDNGGGGGGGAGAVGGTGTASRGGAGGIGTSVYSSWGRDTNTGQPDGNTFYYAGGGGGANDDQNLQGFEGLGGLGGGGKGGTESTGVNAVAGTANTGGGGGGEGGGGAGANGGSGIVIVRYAV